MKDNLNKPSDQTNLEGDITFRVADNQKQKILIVEFPEPVKWVDFLGRALCNLPTPLRAFLL